MKIQILLSACILTTIAQAASGSISSIGDLFTSGFMKDLDFWKSTFKYMQLTVESDNSSCLTAFDDAVLTYNNLASFVATDASFFSGLSTKG